MSNRYRDIAFQEYLEAKYTIDSESINVRVADRFNLLIGRVESLQLLDVGAGTGAVLRRLVSKVRRLNLSYTGLDIDIENSEYALAGCMSFFQAAGYSCNFRESARPRSIVAEKDGARVDARFITGDLFAPDLSETTYDAITAHALLDVLPLDKAVKALARRLRPGGVLYSAVNYDGRTTIVPEYKDPAFETELLETYDKSMDERIVGGLGTGGSRTGTKVYQVFRDAGLTVVGFGASDWSVFPWNGSYGDGDAKFLLALMQMIAEEGTRHANLSTQGLEAWYQDRKKSIVNCGLGLVAHQTDILGIAAQ